MKNNAAIAESYNQAIEAGFNNYLEKYATIQNTEIKIEEEKLLIEIEQKWADTRLPELDNDTPGEYIKAIDSVDELVELFIDMALVSDVGVPDILIDRIKEYGKTAAVKLYGFVESWLECKDQDKVPAVSQAIFGIGCLKFEKYKEKLIGLLKECQDNELLSEAVCEAIIQYDENILNELIIAYQTTEQLVVQEHLLLCTAAISKDHPSNEFFYLIKGAFNSALNKSLVLEILGDYGDARAIPFLRGYILKNSKDLDKQTFNHIRAIIKKLGGEIDDLVYQG